MKDVLIDILREIQKLSTFSVAKLAKSLKKDEALVEHMIARLKAMGYLREDVINDSSCATGCSSCGSICNLRSIKTMSITQKGYDLLKAKA